MNVAVKTNDLDTSSEDAELLAAIDRWVEREVRPIAREYDHADRYPDHLVEQMKEMGLFGATVSPEYGGLGLSAATYAQLVMRSPPVTTVAALPPRSLRALSPGSTHPVGRLILGAAFHDVYHAGQIQMLKRLSAR